jgi:hypothetical protein
MTSGRVGQHLGRRRPIAGVAWRQQDNAGAAENIDEGVHVPPLLP